jgi:hypothetical protein
MTPVELTIKGSIESLRLKPGDVLIATFDASSPELPEDYLQSVTAQIEEWFARRGLPVFVLVLNGVRLSKAT